MARAAIPVSMPASERQNGDQCHRQTARLGRHKIHEPLDSTRRGKVLREIAEDADIRARLRSEDESTGGTDGKEWNGLALLPTRVNDRSLITPELMSGLVPSVAIPRRA